MCHEVSEIVGTLYSQKGRIFVGRKLREPHALSATYMMLVYPFIFFCAWCVAILFTNFAIQSNNVVNG